jgi:hypothetical protein
VTAFVPLTFAPGGAFQFVFSYEDVEIAGQPMRVTVAHVGWSTSTAQPTLPADGRSLLAAARHVTLRRVSGFIVWIARFALVERGTTALLQSAYLDRFPAPGRALG